MAFNPKSLEMEIVALAERDMYLTFIKNQIQEKQKMLVKKRHDLEDKEKDNRFLTDVKNNYTKYYNVILQQKQKQHDMFQKLNKHLADLIETRQLMDGQLVAAKQDHEVILQEVNKIKGELDGLVDGIDATTNNLTNRHAFKPTTPMVRTSPLLPTTSTDQIVNELNSF